METCCLLVNDANSVGVTGGSDNPQIVHMTYSSSEWIAGAGTANPVKENLRSAY
jgi:hypothetical protein